MGKRLIKNILLFLAIFLLLNLLFGSFKNEGTEQKLGEGTLGIATTKENFSRGDTITVQLKNNTKEVIQIPNECPNEPLTVYRFSEDVWKQIAATPKITCADTKPITIEPDKTVTIKYDKWSRALFSNIGKYKIGVTLETEVTNEKEFFSNEFQIKKESVFNIIWTNGFYRPLYNTLIFIAKTLPGHSLGFSIILLTILIRLILLIPSQKAMHSQKKLQEIQPRLDAIKEKFKGDQKRIAQETMAVWKEHKISPFSSCLPLIIQFPFLIALFYVVQSGLDPDQIHLLYDALRQFSLDNIDVNFLNILDLTKINIYWLPLLVGLLQFTQMKLAALKPQKEKKERKSEMEIASSMMIYVLPVMIAVFAASVPAGVGLYWATSTVFGIGQQLIVNKKSRLPAQVV